MPPKPILPEPKLEMSAAAKPARMAIRIAAMIHVPIFDLDTRRKKESIGVPSVLRGIARSFRGEPCRHQGTAATSLREPHGSGTALKKFVAGNWKMHGLSGDLRQIEAIAEQAHSFPQVDVALCVPAILIERAVRAVP